MPLLAHHRIIESELSRTSFLYPHGNAHKHNNPIIRRGRFIAPIADLSALVDVSIP